MADLTAFSTAGEDAITRTVDLGDDVPEEMSMDQFWDYYEIDRTVEEIVKGDYKRIALQFPDELLRDSVPIFRALKSRLGDEKELYVLADTSYGSCCVDEVAAQHVDADAIVHYGHACMSQTSRLPVIYVFGKKAIDPDKCFEAFIQSMSKAPSVLDRKTILLKLDVAYAHKADQILERLQSALSSTQILHSRLSLITYPANRLHNGHRQDAEDHTNKSPEEIVQSTTDMPVNDCTILYVGGESLGLTNLLITHASCEVHSYDPKTDSARLESTRTNKLLMRRYAAVQKARDADVFGILVGTLGVASYLPLISHLRSVLRRAHKKSYTISVGKLNPAKLANFLEIECFVLVACPENSLIEAKDFLRPIVTPYELEIALRAEMGWTGRYILDFDKLLAENVETEDEQETGEEEGDLDQPIFSLVTGKYRHAKRYGISSTTNGTTESSAIILRNQESTVTTLADSAAGEFLQNRTFRGLETRIGQDAPGVLEQGRSGIARGYADDRPS
ncbi:diphthamide biosynthesis protein [Laetiporus sulphureus 93-53]|uniref:2-(3-amino-3-carboxypropyl)histidine synthase subunit 2 n=1 Tax=Laetiporus sulphureus 93-53 TaxID=1314785 RepID=A0A165D2I5_9APHY|nr:diphthamide biosynthesis protein [Laetiporus sulphureus 93-53]KZT04025.1 diphthamide biosynthesis protein [Laetiporus sulphureus 93-53]